MQECPQGTYNKDYGGDSIMSCLDCDPGKYCNGTAQIDITGSLFCFSLMFFYGDSRSINI